MCVTSVRRRKLLGEVQEMGKTKQVLAKGGGFRVSTHLFIPFREQVCSGRTVGCVTVRECVEGLCG